MSKIAELLQEVRKTSGRIEAVEKTIERMGQAQAGAHDVLRKAFHGGAQNPTLMGWDGADTMNLLKIGSVRQKAVGWGRYLQAIHAAATGKDLVQVEKALEKMGSRPINKTALAESSGSTGGYTVPVQFYGELLRLVAEEAFVRSMCMMVPMQSRSLLVPALDQSGTPSAGTSSFFGGIAASWQPEGQTINESEPNWRQIELVARDLVFYTVASNQLLQDNAIALDTLLTTLFREAMAWFMDYYILRGNGANQPLGALNGPNVYAESRSLANHFTLDDVAAMTSHLLLSSWKNACWVMHPSVMPELIQMTNGATNSPFLVWLNPSPNAEGGPAAQQLPMRLLNFPIFWTEKVPTLGNRGDVSLIDFSKQLIGDRLALQIETSPHVKFLNNQMVWRVIARWDSQPWLNKPVTMADGVYKMSNAVTLAA